MSRRFLLILGLLVLSSHWAYPLSPKEVLDTLMEGNKRYVQGNLTHPNRDQEARQAVAQQQQPTAIILGCSDSRVPPEILFDQGIGDIFVVRVAGNVAGDIELDSIDYSALVLKSSIILVLGHENCGAVKAVLANQTTGIQWVAKLIEPSVRDAASHPENTLEYAIKANVRAMMKRVAGSPVIADLIRKGQFGVFGGYYRMDNGQVELLK